MFRSTKHGLLSVEFLTSVMDSINNAAVTAQEEWDSDKEEFI